MPQRPRLQYQRTPTAHVRKLGVTHRGHRRGQLYDNAMAESFFVTETNSSTTNTRQRPTSRRGVQVIWYKSTDPQRPAVLALSSTNSTSPTTNNKQHEVAPAGKFSSNWRFERDH